MGIDFKATIILKQNYYDFDMNLEHQSITDLAVLDLGNYRALRFMDEDCCGTKILNSREADAWLYAASMGAGLQVRLAHEYLASLRKVYAGELDVEDGDKPNIEIEVKVDWS